MTQLHLNQKEIYFDQVQEPQNPHYNIGTYVVIKGDLNTELFKASVLSSQNVFDIFKLGKFSQNEATFELKEQASQPEFEEHEFVGEQWPNESVEKWLKDRVNRPFNIHEDALFDFVLIKRSKDEYWFYMGCHHLFTDGYGVPYIFLKYVFDKYYALRTNSDKAFEFPSYFSIVQGSNEYLTSEAYEKDKAYWLERFKDSQQPIIPEKAENTAGEIRTVRLNFPLSEQEKLRTFCSNHKISLQDLLIALLAVYYKKTEDIGFFDFCLPTHNRTSRKERKTLGLFTKLIPGRLDLSDQSLFDLLEQIKSNQRKDYRHKQFPVSHFNQMIQEGDNTSAPFSLRINYRYFRLETDENELNLKGYKNDASFSKTPLEFSWCDFGENGTEDLFLEILFRTDYYSMEEMELLGERVRFMLGEFYDLLDSPISEIGIIPIEEKNRLMLDFAGKEMDYPRGIGVLDLIEENVINNPNNLAVIYDGKDLTYRELEVLSNQFAHYLIEKCEVSPGDLVGIKFSRCEWTIIAILGVLKASGTYVPIDPTYPQDRIDFIVKDTGISVCLDENSILDFRESDEPYSEKSPGLKIDPNSPAYIIYTSGSTGIPKGVVITHANFYAFIHWSIAEFKASDYDEVFFTTSLNFDLSIFEIFHPLSVGKPLIVLANSLAIPDHLNRDKKYLVNTVPSAIGALLDQGMDFTSISVLNMAGEPIPGIYKERLQGKIGEIRNLYGPSEDTTYSTVYRVDKDHKDLIGKPIANTHIHILNEKSELLPIGCVGEICISGTGLAQGYWNREELSSSKFVSNPFLLNKRMYKTGDLGKWLPDGNIAFLGRKDDQVKVRGYRIELGEIENVIADMDDVERAVVVAWSNASGNKELVAYCSAQQNLRLSDLRTYVKDKLPEYMVPSHFVQLDKIPLTANGKVNKKELPDPLEAGLVEDRVYVAPTNELEEELVNVWTAVLSRDRIGIRDEFYALGGNSLKVVQLNNEYHRLFGARLPLKELFDNKTIEEQAQLIAVLERERVDGIEKVPSQDNYPISDAQRRLWMLSQFEKSSVAYNMPGNIILTGDYDSNLLQRTFDFLIERHEILRTVFREDENGNVRQFVLNTEDIGFRIKFENCLDRESPEEFIRNYTEEDAYKPFNLEKGPLLRATFFQVEPEKFLFYFNMHHIIGDGWSIGVLYNEFLNVYQYLKANKKPELPPLKIQYKDYSVWQLSRIESDVLREGREFWKNRLSGDLPALDLPGAKQRPKIKTSNGCELITLIDPKSYAKLKEFVAEHDASLFTGLLSCWNVLLYHYTKQEDLIIGTPVAGRDHFDLENQIGFYVNTLALRNQINPNETFDVFFERVKKNALECYEHQSYPFDRLVNELNLERDISRSAVFDFILTLQNDDKRVNQPFMENLAVSEITNLGKTPSKLDISVVFEEVGEELSFLVTFNTDLFEVEMIHRLMNHFSELLNAILSNPSVKVGEVDYLSQEEKSQLADFNGTGVEYPLDQTVLDLFSARVSEHPEAVALSFEGKEITYRELDEQSNQLAHFLLEKYGIEAEDMVGVCQYRSEWMLISILGILKAGGAYVPIDPDFPADRQAFIKEDTGYKLCLDAQTLAAFKGIREDYSIAPVEVSITSSELAYVIYTSGSTGKPKGVLLEHGGLVNRLLWMQDDLSISDTDVFIQKTPFTFDVSVWELFLPLVVGSKLVIAKPGGHKEPVYLETVLSDHQVSIIHFVPSMLVSALDQIDWSKASGLRHVVCSGEALPKKAELDFGKQCPQAHLNNYYGPTEATIDVTAIDLTHEPTEGHEVSIGRPIANTSIYIVNEQTTLQGIGIPGELLIGGIQVARGYLNREELTKEKFIADPFGGEGKLYRTGDLVRWLPDGRIEFTGRKDDQVKVRGYRIELGEIEYALSGIEGVEQAVVLASEDEEGDKKLQAYVVPGEDKAYTVRQILSQNDLDFEFKADLYELNNGISFYAYNRAEAKMLYNEVFEEKAYYKNGIYIPENACILDVGANIGAFSIFSLINFEKAKIYAFEPLSPIHSLLEKNVSLYPGDIEVFNYGISSKQEEAVFDYYPYATVLSGKHSEENDIKETVKRFIGNTNTEGEELSDQQMEELLESRLISKKYKCELRSLSQVIKEQSIAHIDLLKIDVENAEMDIIDGIEVEDWDKIDQIIIEVHDLEGRLDRIEGILNEKGFKTAVFQEGDLEGTKLYNVYAIKNEAQEKVNGALPVEENWYGANAYIADLKERLKRKLPDYMVPSEVILMNNFPLTLNGKVDRKKLLKNEGNGLVKRADFIAPRNEFEKSIAEIWKLILHKEKIGVEDDFFVLGGHSLKATKLISEYHKRFNVKLTLVSLFNHTTLSSHAALLKKTDKTNFINISSAPLAKSYPISDAQRRLWILCQFEDNSVAYNVPGSIRLSGHYDLELLEKAFSATISRHEILRTVFKENEQGEVQQWILPELKETFKIVYLDLRSKKDKEKAVTAYIQNDSFQTFDLEKGPLLRAALLQLENNEYVFYFNIHHIISDGWSMDVLSRDVFTYYDAYYSGKAPSLSKLPIQYKDYSCWQLGQIESEEFKIHRSYWLGQFKGEISVMNLPTNKVRPKVKSNNGHTLGTYLSEEDSQNLKNYCLEHDGSLFMGLLASVKTLLYRYTGERDVVIGSPVAGREHADLENQIGFYVNTLALRNEVDGKENFDALFKQVRENTLKAYNHQAYPFDRLVNELDLRRDTSRNALFDIMLTLQNTGEESGAITLSRESIESIVDYGEEVARLDIGFTFQEVGKHISIRVNYNTDIYDSQIIEAFISHYKQMLSAILESPDAPLDSYNYLSEKEKNELLYTFNTKISDCPRDITIIDFFEKQVEKTPDLVAIVFEDQELTYKALNERSNQFSRYLQSTYEICADDRIGIQLDRSEKMIIAILGVLKSGAAYVPIDTEYPQDRIDHMIADSECKIVIDSEELGRFILQEDEFSNDNLDTDIRPNDLAYVIYTSGSTGQSKGVMIEHYNLLTSIDSRLAFYESGETFLLLLSFSFDSSIGGMFGTLCGGGKIVLSPPGSTVNPEEIAEIVLEKKVTHLMTVSSYYEVLINLIDRKEASLNVVTVGGEECSENLVKGHFDTKFGKTCRLINEYGPTESTIWCVCHEYKIDVPFLSTIGQPVSNAQIYILNDSNQLQPKEIVGEICVTGNGIARGYLNQPELTKEKFIANPFAKGERIYRTGDLGRWLPDGNIEFLGRKDDQVKIRGYRVELGEIEHSLLGYEGIDSVVVLAKTNKEGEKELVAYLTSEVEQNTLDLRGYLQQELPAFMLPSHFVQLEKLPFTPNGKVDKKALPDPEGMGLSSGVEYIAPKTEKEKELATIWEAVLDQSRIGIHDDFFALGGHSLKAIRLINEYQKRYAVKLSIQDVFTHTTLSSHIALLEATNKTDFITISPIAPAASYAISDAQRRLWVLSQFEENAAVYNMPVSTRLTGDYDAELLQKSFDATIARHEILRTVFKENEAGEVHQWILPATEQSFKIATVDFRKKENKEEAVTNYIQKDSFKAFDLEKGPLLRAALLQVEQEEYVFYFNMHHIISDGWSMDVLSKDVFAFYEALQKEESPNLKELPIQYKDYSAWQLAQLKEAAFEEHRDYWLTSLSGELPVVDLPANHPRPVIKTSAGHSLSTYLNEEATSSLNSFTAQHGGSLFMSLTAVWNVLMYRYTGQEDVITGTVTAGRDHADLENQIGFYVNTLALRNKVDSKENFIRFYQKVKTNTFNAFEHQMYPFDRLVEELNLRRDTSRSAVFDIMLTLQNTVDKGENLALSAAEIQAIKDEGESVSKFDLDITFREVGDKLSFYVTYNPDVYEVDMVTNLMVHYKALLSELLSNPNQQIGAIDYLPEAEKTALLTNFNSTAATYPTDKSLVDLFEEQVTNHPDSIAVVYEDKQLTYRELSEKSNQLGAYLQATYQIIPDDLVGIKLERSEWMLVTILGVLKSGGAYVPIDPTYPQERIEYIETDSNSKVCIDEKELEQFKSVADDYSTTLPKTTVTPNHLAYVIYTSGSTGKPKGVMVERHSVLDYVYTFAEKFQINKSDRIAQQSSVSFDVSVEEIFPTLCFGASLVMIPGGAGDIDRLLNTLEKEQVTILSTVPLVVNEINAHADRLTSLRLLISGGDELKFTYLSNLLGKTELYNTYGPTESTVCATYQQINNPEDTQLLGQPIANRSIYILDAHGGLLPQGVEGEICIGGAGLARGYFKREELTGEKFISHPFIAGERLYRSGDLGRITKDGVLEFRGRLDDQVKIRGFRVELGEIEQVLSGYDGINAVIVLDKNINGKEKELVTYLTASIPLTKTDLRTYLQSRLPGYMIPSYYVQLENLPVNANGKVNKRALPEPEGAEMESGITYVAPQNEIEEQLLNIWQEVLGKEVIGIDEGFFEAGGNSIRTITLRSKIEQKFGIECSVTELFQYVTIRMQANMIANGKSISPQEDLKEFGGVTDQFDTDIAVIGMAIKAPMTKDLHEFWDNLKEGKESVTFFTEEELLSAGISQSQLEDENYVKSNSYLENKECFDASFFGYLPDEAKLMDPQTRVFHETVWSALEDAGYDPFSYSGSIGLYAGAGSNMEWEAYSLLSTENRVESFAAENLRDKDFLTTLVANKLNLRGGVNTINTACSTSLVAIHHAALSLITGENTMAMAGGVSIKNKKREEGYLYRPGMINSQDGHNRTFDKDASGTVGSEGSGAVVLKRLSEALKDGDQVYAVIKGSAINNDGNRKVGYAAPSVEGQVEVIKMAQARAGVKPHEVSYVEAHGTATKLGDPIEVLALAEVFGSENNQKCALGAVKSNIGHMDAAAGVAGFIKTALLLKNRKLVPSLHFKTPNPEINFDKIPFYVNTEYRDWEVESKNRIAGVSSFGIGGTNAHIIMEQPPASKKEVEENSVEQVFTLSAKTLDALQRHKQNLSDFLAKNEALSFHDLAFTLNRKKKFPVRAAFVAKSMDELRGSLSEHLNVHSGGEAPNLGEGKVVFMFSGQGAQYANMGRDLYNQEDSIFRNTLDKCFKIARKHSALEFEKILFPEDAQNQKEINETINTQPILFMVEYAMAKQLMHYGIKPDMMIGHSIGEFSAACLSGVIGLEDTIRLVIKRGELMQRLPKGIMLAVGVEADQVKNYLSESVDLAAVNTPESCVLSGTVEAIESLSNELEKNGIPSRVLHTSHAFHSHMMDAILDQFTSEVEKVKISEPLIPYISNLSGKEITKQQLADKKYWANHIRGTVQFSEGVKELIDNKGIVLIEVGPGTTLSSFAQHHARKGEAKAFSTIRHPKLQADDYGFYLEQMTKLWESGVDVKWNVLFEGTGRSILSLPTYPFEQVKYPLAIGLREKMAASIGYDLMNEKAEVSDWFYEKSWRKSRLMPLETDKVESTNALVFCDNDNLAKTFIENLNQTGNYNVRVVVQGDEFDRVDKMTFVLNPKNEEHYKKLYNELLEEDYVPNEVFHFWLFTGRSEIAHNEVDKVSNTLNLGYHSLLHFMRVVGDRTPFEKMRINAITSGCFSVNSGDVVIPSRAMIAGALSTISKEYMNISTKHIDLSFEDGYSDIVQFLTDELYDQNDFESMAYRYGNRWVPFYDKIPLVGVNENQLKFREQGVYLITGGTGGMGLVFAKYLKEHFNAKLILTGRKPKQEVLPGLLAAFGDNVDYINPDVSNFEEVQTQLAAVEKKRGGINGIIHTAGIGDFGGIIQNRTKKQCEDVFVTKIYGTLVLDMIAKTRNTDFLILCSSAAAAVAPFGQVAYTAANTFQNSWAEATENYLVQSIGWDTWSEVGMAVQALSEQPVHERNKALMYGISNKEGIEVLQRILASRIPALLVSTRDIDLLLKEEEKIEANDEQQVVLSRPHLANEYEPPGTETEEEICAIFEGFFGVREIGVLDNFFDLGIDSLKAMTLINHIHQKLNLELRINDVLENPSIRELGQKIESLRKINQMKEDSKNTQFKHEIEI